jgi:hypothetical protein
MGCIQWNMDQRASAQNPRRWVLQTFGTLGWGTQGGEKGDASTKRHKGRQRQNFAGPCMMGKQSMESISRKWMKKPTTPLGMVDMDACGPFPVRGRCMKQFLMLTDRATTTLGILYFQVEDEIHDCWSIGGKWSRRDRQGGRSLKFRADNGSSSKTNSAWMDHVEGVQWGT